MVYREKFVAVVKCDGRILREINNVVTLPFGSEYSILFKNLEGRKASVNVSIDGQDVLYNKSLIIEPNEKEFELKRFIENLDQGNKFKFIQKTQKIVDHRGDRIDDGLIRIEFAFEQKVIQDQIQICRPFTCCPSMSVWETDYSYVNCSGNTVSTTPQNINLVNDFNVLSTLTVNEQQINVDEGITVQGGQSNQQFYYGNIGLLEQSNVIIIRLRGETSKGKVKKSITVKSKLKCPTCGTKSKSNIKFCSECGTSLI